MNIFSTTMFVFLAAGMIGCNENAQIKINLVEQPEILEVFAEPMISTGMYERDIAISPDGREIIYTLSNYKQNKRCLVVLRKIGDSWGEREILSFSGTHQDIEPFFSPDGQKLFFASDRPMESDSGRSDYNIWVTSRTIDDWQKPTPLPKNINSAADEFYPSVTKTGNLYFTSSREEGLGKEDIFVSKFIGGQFLDPMPLDSGVNSEVYEFNAFISPDENLIIFSSFGRKNELGGGDLYYSAKDENGNWSVAKNMGEIINSPRLDYCPFIDYQRGNFYFTSDRSDASEYRFSTVDQFIQNSNKTLNGMGNIYRISLSQLDLE